MIDKTLIIAEVANSHSGCPETAIKIGEAGIDAGADIIKFQVYFADELLVSYHERYDHFHNQSFSTDDWDLIFSHFRSKDINLACDIFGSKALEVAKKHNIKFLKIHSSDLQNDILLNEVDDYEPELLIISSGGARAPEISHALNLTGNCKERVLMHGFQSYPTEVRDSRLNRIFWLENNFGKIAHIGYQDHVDGDDAFAFHLPMMALSAGAKVIEKHITLDRSKKGTDYFSSLNPDEFFLFVQKIREGEKAIHSSACDFSDAEINYRKTVMKRMVSLDKLKRGDLIKKEDIGFKRVSNVTSESPKLSQIVGKKLISDLDNEDMITRNHFRCTCWALLVVRSNSSRLPGKAFIDVAGMPALNHLIERLKQARSVDKIIVCTTDLSEDNSIEDLALSAGVECYRGENENVLSRMVGALGDNDVDVALRITGDDILVDPSYIDIGLDHHLSTNSEYSDLKDLPSGTEVEFFDADLLRNIYKLGENTDGTEYLTFYITRNKDQFNISSVPVSEHHSRSWRLTLDTQEDYKVISKLLLHMSKIGKDLDYRLDDIVSYFEQNPEELKVNEQVRQRMNPPKVNTTIGWGKALKG